jgi:hypothetical protein
MSAPRFASFEEFWPHYVREHARPLNRFLHVAGTTAALGCVAVVGLSGAWPMLLVAPVVGYGASWLGHRFFQSWPPAAFHHPWWSLLGDLRMWWLTVRGRMGDEVLRATTA